MGGTITHSQLELQILLLLRGKNHETNSMILLNGYYTLILWVGLKLLSDNYTCWEWNSYYGGYACKAWLFLEAKNE